MKRIINWTESGRGGGGGGIFTDYIHLTDLSPQKSEQGVCGENYMYLCSYKVGKMEEDSFDSAVGCVLWGGGRH